MFHLKLAVDLVHLTASFSSFLRCFCIEGADIATLTLTKELLGLIFKTIVFD